VDLGSEMAAEMFFEQRKRTEAAEAEIQRLRSAAAAFVYRFESAATGSSTTPQGRIAVDREQWRVASLMCQRLRSALEGNDN
jgi:hypothetical protein